MQYVGTTDAQTAEHVQAAVLWCSTFLPALAQIENAEYGHVRSACWISASLTFPSTQCEANEVFQYVGMALSSPAGKPLTREQSRFRGSARPACDGLKNSAGRLNIGCRCGSLTAGRWTRSSRSLGILTEQSH